MNNLKPIDQVAEEATTHFYKLFVYGPYFFLNLLLWNGLGFFALEAGIVSGWSHLAFIVVGAISTTYLSIRADHEYFIESFLKKEGYDVKTISWNSSNE